LTKNLQEIGVETVGSSQSCRKRLKFHLRNQAVGRLANLEIMNSYCYDCVVVVDFEATCEIENQSTPTSSVAPSPSKTSSSTQEIIEFPAILVDVRKKQIVSTFHSFVKPSKSSISQFCTQLTGITQSQVDTAMTFREVLDSFEDWLYMNLKKHGYNSFAFASDGSWDFGHFFANSCAMNGVVYPSYSKRWINVRKVFSSYYRVHSYSLSHMLSYLGMEFEGRKHSGFDDSNNIARLLIRMLLDGANPVINERISWHSIHRSSWHGMKPGVVKILACKPCDGLNLSDSEDDLFQDKYRNKNKDNEDGDPNPLLLRQLTRTFSFPSSAPTNNETSNQRHFQDKVLF